MDRERERITFDCRAVGMVMLEPFVDEDTLANIGISQRVDYGMWAYHDAYHDEPVIPIGALTGGTRGPVPIFQIASFLPPAGR
jgi:hypothetical protein